jgi:MoxR-like ATPase
MKAAQVCAILKGRRFVTPDDIKHIAIPVLSHRIILKGHTISGGTSNQEAAVSELMKTVPVPTESF